jgi:hypothetical protein
VSKSDHAFAMKIWRLLHPEYRIGQKLALENFKTRKPEYFKNWQRKHAIEKPEMVKQNSANYRRRHRAELRIKHRVYRASHRKCKA